MYAVARWILLAALAAGAVAAVAAALFGLEVAGYWNSSRQQAQAKITTLEFQNFAMKAELGRASEEAAKSSELIASSHRRMTALAMDAAEAKKSVLVANERAADAEKRAVEASRELERYKTSRTLSQEQQSQLTERLRRFEKTPFEFSVAPGSEAIALHGAARHGADGIRLGLECVLSACVQQGRRRSRLSSACRFRSMKERNNSGNGRPSSSEKP